jgi:chitobiase/beta-hexosaminidase-like protein
VSLPKNFGNIIGATPITPTFSPAAGSFVEPQVVLIISAGADAIYFTIDGTIPTTASPLYKGSVRVNVTTTIKTIAVVDGVASSVGMAAYVIS